jgi:hypothetical protein
MNNLQLLIKKAESRNKKSSFTVSTKFTLEDIFEDKDKTEITYCEDDLTKNYVKFLKDVFTKKYGPVTMDQIEALGDSIKSDITDFKKSYQTKKSVIKEIVDGVFVHTALNSESMRIKIKNVVESFNGMVTWPKDTSDELKHCELLEDDIISTDGTIKKMHLFQFEREGLEDGLNKKISPLEFKRFAQDFSSTYFASFFDCLEICMDEWKKNPNKYKSDDYRD